MQVRIMQQDEAVELALKRGKIEASIYDLLYEFPDDVSLYIDYVKSTGDPVLECACGTGRVLIPLARSGLRVIGIDVSDEMLGTARAKIEKESLEVQRRIRLEKTDMRDFKLKERFGLCIIPAASLIQLQTVEDQRQTLRTILSHLRQGGCLILDSFNPDLTRPQGLLRLERLKSVGRGVLMQFTVQYFDVPKHHTFGWVLYDFVKPDGSVRREFVPFRYRYFFAEEIQQLLREVGYRVESVFGDFEKTPFQPQSSRIIIVARKL